MCSGSHACDVPSPHSVVAATYLWANGMVMSFDDDGEQIQELQGPVTEALALICACGRPAVTWVHDWTGDTDYRKRPRHRGLQPHCADCAIASRNRYLQLLKGADDA